MKERPILFSTPMVKALLDGRKTMTRRVLKPQPEDGAYPHHDEADGVAFANPCSFHKYRFFSGDRLWVRETWYSTPDKKDLLGYVADNDIPHGKPYRIRPSIFMSRTDSRIDLEITGVRVERLQEITEEDAMNEGVNWQDTAGLARFTAKKLFINLWDSINGKKYPWSSNPFVWVVEFKRITQL
jgi:hypothetical protein